MSARIGVGAEAIAARRGRTDPVAAIVARRTVRVAGTPIAPVDFAAAAGTSAAETVPATPAAATVSAAAAAIAAATITAPAATGPAARRPAAPLPPTASRRAQGQARQAQYQNNALHVTNPPSRISTDLCSLEDLSAELSVQSRKSALPVSWPGKVCQACPGRHLGRGAASGADDYIARKARNAGSTLARAPPPARIAPWKRIIEATR
jgi:hypothetical protein